MKRKSVLILFCALVVYGGLATHSVKAETDRLPPPPAPDPELVSLPITATLFNFADHVQAKSLSGDALKKAAESAGLLVLDARLINVEIVNRKSEVPVDESLVLSVGGEIDAVWRSQVAAWIPPDRAVELARLLPTGYFLRHAHLAYDNDQGPATVRSDTYRDAGSDGTGITVGIIDRNFNLLDTAETQGVVPVAIRHNYTSSAFLDGSSLHGTAHLETVFDHAPGATYHVFRIGNSTHLGLAVDDAAAEGVNILSATQSFYNEGWDDNSGLANAAVITASNSDILYFSSSGNRAETHWQGMYSDPLNSTWMDWAPGDATNGLTEVQDGSFVMLFLQWDRYTDGPNLDLYLLDSSSSQLASSTSGSDNFESIYWENNLGHSVFPSIAVHMVSGNPVEVEVFNIGTGNFEYAVAAGSITSPNTNTAVYCLAVGAVPYNNYSEGNLASYSSQGPTNSGNTGIDLVGPTNTFSWVYGGSFGGTSCSTPNTAGAAAALWSSVPGFSSAAIKLLVLHQANVYNDWGADGIDPVYGFGGLFYVPFAANNVWVDRSGFNFDGLPSVPWYYLQDAVDNSASGDCLQFIEGIYYEPILLEDPRILRSAGQSARIGGF